MNENLQPVGNDPLEARITAWVLGEASPFEVAELESLVAKSPELQLFLNRTRALHVLLQEAETTANAPSEDWKLPTEKRDKLDEILGAVPVLVPHNESRIRRASFRAAWGIAAVFVVTFFSLRLLPRDYEAEAVIEIKPRERVFNPLGGKAAQAPAMTSQFFGTEFEKIKSRNSLEKVVDELDLTARWNTDKETALKKLKASIETENIKGTDLVAIRVRQPDEQEAKEITRAVAEEYRDYRSSLEEKQQELAVNELRKAVREMEDKVEDRRKILTTISRTKNIVYYGDKAMTRGGVDENLEANSVQNMRNELEGERMQLESQIQSLLKYDGEALATYASGLDLPDNIIKSLYPQKLELKREVERLKAEGLGKDHPTVVQNTRILNQMDEQLDEGVVNLRTRLQGQLDMAKERLAKVEVRKKETKDNALERSIDTSDYVDAKRDFETDLALLEQMKFKLITEEIAAETPNDSIVIHDAPTITGKKIPSNPLAALKIAITPESKSSAATAPAKMAAAEPAREKIEIAGNTRAVDKAIRREVPAESEAEMDKTIAAKPAAPAVIPVPEIAALEPSTDFGGGNNFSGGFADNGLRSGGAAETNQSLATARERRKVGKTDEARDLLEKAEASAPDDRRIKEEIAYLEDPIRTNPALTNEHSKDVDQVRRNLYMAQGNYDLGKYDDAKKAYEDTLRIDPHNSAARRGMEKIQAAKSDYYRAAYDHTRAELLTEVDSASKLEVPAEEGNADLSPPPQAKSLEGADQDARAELLAQVDKAWELSVPADTAEKEKGSDKEVDPFAAPDESGSLADAFSDGIDSDFKKSEESGGRLGITPRSGAERSDISVIREFEYPSEYEAPVPGNLELEGKSQSGPVFSVTPAAPTDFDGFTNYGAPIAGEPKQIETITKFTEITQANDKELGFDWILPLDNKKEGEADPAIPVTPATPTDFESRLSGATLEVAPILGDIPVVGRLLQEKKPSLADLSQEIPAAQEPFSTFSLNISDASFQLALAAVEKGERPDPESIKPEQFYNAVDYGDPAPSSLEPVAAAIDQTAHPVIPGRNLVRVAIRTASTGRSAAQPLRLTLMVDQSGSMARADRRAAMDTALAQLATLLTENDRITVIGFSRTPRLIADSLPGNEAAKISDLVNPTASEGGTNLEQALNLSSELALRHKLDGAQNRIVLFTDGAANLGDADPDRLAERVKELRQQGLAFDIAGIGTNDTNDRLLSELARHGNGRYYLVGENTGTSLAAQLAGAFRPAAENVKVQVKLNPERVGSYKLIGFEKDRLKTEDFRDDSVDAAELAADEAGVAIYQVETLPEGSGEIGEVSVRFRDTASGEMVERAWTIPHNPATPALDKAEAKTQLATLALLAAQKLQGGPLADAIRFSDHAETIAKLKQTYANDAKAQRLLTLINALR